MTGNSQKSASCWVVVFPTELALGMGWLDGFASNPTRPYDINIEQNQRSAIDLGIFVFALGPPLPSPFHEREISNARKPLPGKERKEPNMREMIKAAAIKFARNVHSLTEQDLSEIRVEYRDNRLRLNLCLQFGPSLDIVDIEVIAGSESTDLNFLSLGFDEIEALSNEALVAKVEMEIEKAILNHPGISLETKTSFDGSLSSLGLSVSQNTIVGNAAKPASDSEVQHLLEKTAELKRMIADLALENHILKASVSIEGHNPGDPGGQSQS